MSPDPSPHAFDVAPLVAMLAHDATTQQVETALHCLLEQPDEAVLLHLQRHRLDQLVLRLLLDHGLDTLPGEAGERLRQGLIEPLRLLRRRQALSLMLRQEGAQVAGQALEAAGLTYVLFKGILLGEMLYDDPLLRPSADIDLLINETDRGPAHDALLAAGFELAPQVDQPAYEVSYIRQGANLDLHWHPIEPGRSRIPLTPFFLEHRQERDGLWFPSPQATFLALLLNPAISDYVSERLIQPLDVDRFLRRVDFDPTPTVELLQRAGLAAAGWTMLEHSRRLFTSPVPSTVEDALRPAPWRQRHLRRWLERDPAQTYLKSPWWVRVSFSLLLHDRPSDGLRALVASLAEKWRTRGARRPITN